MELCVLRIVMGLVIEMRGYPRIQVWGQFGTPTRNVVVQLMTVVKVASGEYYLRREISMLIQCNKNKCYNCPIL
jgi:hypothetical protein